MPIEPLAWEPLHASDAALKRQKTKQTNKKKLINSVKFQDAKSEVSFIFVHKQKSEFVFCLFRGAPMAYGDSLAQG